MDEGRLREVYAVAYPRLVGQLVGVTGDPAEAEDVVMEAFARAAPRRSSFHEADNPEAWLRTVAVNVARSRWRRMLRWAHLVPALVADRGVRRPPRGPPRADGGAAPAARRAARGHRPAPPRRPAGRRGRRSPSACPRAPSRPVSPAAAPPSRCSSSHRPRRTTMSDLDQLPDLAGDVRERVVTPPYDEVSRRVRARRLRGAAGVDRRGGPGRRRCRPLAERRHDGRPVAPAAGRQHPGPDPADRRVAMARRRRRHRRRTRSRSPGTDDGSVAIVWRALEHPEPTFALVIREADGSVHGRRLDVPVTLTPVPGGWVGLETTRGWLIASDGSWTDLGAARDAASPTGGRRRRRRPVRPVALLDPTNAAGRRCRSTCRSTGPT